MDACVHVGPCSRPEAADVVCVPVDHPLLCVLRAAGDVGVTGLRFRRGGRDAEEVRKPPRMRKEAEWAWNTPSGSSPGLTQQARGGPQPGLDSSPALQAFRREL